MRLRRKLAMVLSTAMLLSALPANVWPGLSTDGSATVMGAERDDVWKMMTTNEWEGIKQTNRNRMKAGLELLSVTQDVQNGAKTRADELTVSFSHTRPDGSKFGTVMGEGGIYITGENIADGFILAEDVVQAWMDSQGHKDNILNARYCHVGIKRNNGSWAQLFTYCDNSVNQNTKILTASTTPVVLQGTSIEDLQYLVQFTCSSCKKTAWIPVMNEMCDGYNPNKIGQQTVTVTCKNWTGTFPVTVRAPILVDNIYLSGSEIFLKTGETERLTARTSPTTADDSRFEWKSTNPAVAMVIDGSVKGLSAGTAEIYCVARDQGKKESNRCKVTVTQLVTSIEINGGNQSLKPGDKVKLTAYARPDAATNKELKWYSANSEVASVDSQGTVTALTAGETKIYCMAQDGSEVRSRDCLIQVTANSTNTQSSQSTSGSKNSSGSGGSTAGQIVGAISITPIDINCTVGYQTTMSASVSPENAQNKSVTWYSTNENVAVVSQQGVMQAKAAGSAQIYCVSKDGGNVQSNHCSVFVRSSGSSGSSGSGSSGSKSSTSSSSSVSSSKTSGISLPSYVKRGRWEKKGDGFWAFTDSSGQAYKNIWAAVENPYASASRGQQGYDWFRFDERGNMLTGWFYDGSDENWYYLNPVSDNTLGRMMTGWQLIGGYYYYFNPYSDGHRGRMYAGETTPDGYYVDPNGRWIP